MENDGDILHGVALLHICSGAGVGGEAQPLSPELQVTQSPCQTSASFRLSPKGAELSPSNTHLSLPKLNTSRFPVENMCGMQQALSQPPQALQEWACGV